MSVCRVGGSRFIIRIRDVVHVRLGCKNSTYFIAFTVCSLQETIGTVVCVTVFGAYGKYDESVGM